MRIGIDGSVAALTGSGTGRYASLLVRHLVSLDHDNDYVLYFRSRDRRQNPLWGVQGSRLRSRVTDAPLTLLRLHLNLPVRLRADDVDLYHSLGFFLPWLWRGKTVVTIHDIHPVLLSDHWWAPGNRTSYLALRAHIPLALAQADFILTPSAYVKETIRERFRVEEQRIVVTPHGVDPFFLAAPTDDELEAADRRWGPGPFFLYVGALASHKNVGGLLTAFAKVQRTGGLRLVLVGTPVGGYREDVLLPLIRDLGLGEAVVLAGYVDDALLRCLYRRAVALVLPSFGEGFGLPLLEAMASGTPIITSAVSALPEVAGDAAVYVNPREAEDIAAVMERVLADGTLRRELAARGARRAAAFTWDRTVSQILQVYRSA
ncbi:MAG TPA: glycosyltransferase family 1 protein [Methylomirabilota bacterium]|jgi:glycosyltransferase involved in cell wall biosynthesis|nr:glycosyltransferase family 1 protein [Methylomirabilota bacterium]